MKRPTGDLEPLSRSLPISLSGENLGAYCLGSTLQPGAGCTLVVRFTPGALGLRTATLAVSGGAINSPQNVALTGVGAVGVPSVGFIPEELDFGNQKVGTTSTVRSVIIQNTGGAALLITNLVVTGVNSGDFLLGSDNCINSPIAPGGTCIVNLQFTPSATGVGAAELQVFDNAGGSPHSLPLTGTGLTPSAALDPTAVDFGEVQLGTNSNAQTVTVTNDGVLPLVLGGVRVAGANSNDFLVTSATCSNQTLAAGQTCTITLIFQPTALGARAATLEVDSDSLDSPHTAALAGVGIAPEPILCLSPGVVFFATGPGQTSTVQQVNLLSCGLTNLVITGFEIQGAGSNDFLIVNDPCTGQSLPPGNSCDIGLVYIGPAAGGGSSATLVITSNDDGSPFAVLLIGAECSLSISPDFLPNGSIGTPYSVGLSVLGATPPVVWSVVAGELPAGLTLTGGGTVTGTPITGGAYVFTVQARDSLGCIGVMEYSLVIGCPSFFITPTALPAAVIGHPYDESLDVTLSGVDPMFIRIAGVPPPGVELNTNGWITGTPTALGTYQFTVLASLGECTANRSYVLQVVCPTISVQPGNLPFGQLYVPYSVTLTATNGTAPYTFVVTGGSLPFGISLTSDGTLSGTPLSPSSAFTVTVTDAYGCSTIQQFVLFIAIPPPSILVGPPSLPAATVDDTYLQALSAAGAEGTVQFALAAGAAPAGLALSANGEIAGVPTVPGDYQFAVLATDNAGNKGSRVYSLSVACRNATIEPASLPGPVVGSAYEQTLSLSDSTPASYTVTGGSLPAGLTLSAAGVLAGTPTTAGLSSFTVKATGGHGCVVHRTISLNVATSTGGGGATDLGVQVAFDPVAVVQGGNLTCVVTVTNAGPAVATGVTVVQDFSDPITVVSKPAGMIAAGNALVATVPALPAGAAVSFTVVLRADAAGSLLDAVTVMANETDLNPSNNGANVSATILAQPPTVQVVRANEKAVIADQDQDQVKLRLKGAGEIHIVRDPSGAIIEIQVLGTDARSGLSIKVKKGKTGGNGRFDLARLVGPGRLGSIKLKGVRLVGDGLAFGGAVRKLALGDVAAGVAVVVGGTADDDCQIKMHVLEAGAQIQCGSKIRKLIAAQLREGQIIAPAVNGVKVKGDKKQGLAPANEAVIVETGLP
ncbi:choice-of-anchor D domain-containing protein [bacterium]|nr:choice-of-anchor D domain-containing protein [bacterium]